MRSLGATSFVFDENDYLQTIKHHGDEAEAKLSFLSQVADRIGISLNQCACIADGANDAAMFKPGQPVLPEPFKGDNLSIASNAILRGGTHSYRFDNEGFPGQRIPVIADGVLKQYWGTAQHAQYLGIKPTGAFGNIEIPPGTCSWDELFQGSDRVILVHQFSTFDPQPVAGNYLGEIRVGYEYRADGTVIPLRGGSVTGNVVDGMINCRFSRECETFYGYFGPRGIRFERAQVAGD